MSKINRLNYIGSKFQLLEWLEEQILLSTGYENFNEKNVADLFAGTGIVSHFFRTKQARVISNDSELYSFYITLALTSCIYNSIVQEKINEYNLELEKNNHLEASGLIVNQYSPNETCERMFFTVDNAKRIQYLRQRIEDDFESKTIDIKNYVFLIASLIVSSDYVSNVPAVYGCYLKKYKDKALKGLVLQPVHNNSEAYNENNKVFNSDVLNDGLFDQLKSIEFDIVYLDPPYNERQYSKNYFPLNMIALDPKETEKEVLKGKTGIPESCFTSDFCKKGKVKEAFDKLFKNLNTKYIFVSYNSEGLLSKDQMIELMSKYGEASVVEKDYKRFKSFDYESSSSKPSNNIIEYLFCLKK
jgi:adenine-specific DNA-methyltransferase